MYPKAKNTFSLSAALIDIARSVIEHSQHRNNPVACAVCALDITSRATNTVNSQANPACVFTNFCALFQCVIYALDTVIFHSRSLSAGIEQSRRCMRKPF